MPSPSPAVDQYRESVPTAKGPKPTGGGGKGAKLPPAVSDQIAQQAGQDAEALESIATSPSLGAPATSRGGDRQRPSGAHEPRDIPGAEGKSALPAAAEATFDGGSGGMLLLIAGGLATLAVVAGLAVSRRKPSA